MSQDLHKESNFPNEEPEKKNSLIDNKQEFVRPPVDILGDIVEGIKYVLFNPNANLIVMPILLMVESMALKLIIVNVHYTEIDYKAYMEQIDMIKYDKNLNYLEITGGTGPLVYPAGHVLIYKIMYWITNGMENVSNGQDAFRYLYLLTLFHQFMVYYFLEVPPWCVALACFSKRLHSIYVLRLFNDCFTTFFIICTTFGFLKASVLKSSKGRLALSTLSSLIYSFAISIKMNALLFSPAVLVSIYLVNEGNLMACIPSLAVIIGLQFVVALPFLKEYPTEYLHGAFDFKRQFMFKWSINWQFIGEEGFLSPLFQRSLLVSQLVLILMVLLMKYPTIFHDLFNSLKHPATRVKKLDERTPFTIAFLMIVINFIGIIFSRSLHYQFLTWYHWTIPILVSWSGLPIYIGPIWYVLHEYCWNSYPPNSMASALLISLNSLMLLLVLANQTICKNNKTLSEELFKKKQY